MLNTIYRDAIRKREEVLSFIKGSNFRQILAEAKSNWIEYYPKKKSITISGIDSSFNCIKFQGMELWVVNAVSVKPDGKILADSHDHGIGYTDTVLSSLASKMEIEVCKISVSKTNFVLMDGSLYSQFMTRQKELTSSIIDIMSQNENVIFISKTSNTRMQFMIFGSGASDIFYYNHVTKKPGFSKIFVDKRFGKNKYISSIFVRLSEYTPIIKLELLGGEYTDSDIRSILDRLYNNSINGYPYALKLAHQKCKVSNNDLSKLASLYGLNTETRSREVLE